MWVKLDQFVEVNHPGVWPDSDPQDAGGGVEVPPDVALSVGECGPRIDRRIGPVAKDPRAGVELSGAILFGILGRCPVLAVTDTPPDFRPAGSDPAVHLRSVDYLRRPIVTLHRQQAAQERVGLSKSDPGCRLVRI